MSDWLEGRRVLVTGASSGIGAGLAEAMAAAGAVVGICARRKDRLAETLERCRVHSSESRMLVTDLSDLDQVDRLAGQVTEELGPLDVLVNNAGIPKRRHVTALDAATVEAVMRINYLSPVRLTLALLPRMLEQPDPRVVNIASIAAPLSSPNEAAYSASKAALASFSESLAVDLWDTPLSVTIVYPGIVDTELFHLPDNDPPPGPLDAITVEEAAASILAGVEAKQLHLYVPEVFGQYVKSKSKDPEGFLAGSAAYVRQQRQGE